MEIWQLYRCLFQVWGNTSLKISRHQSQGRESAHLLPGKCFSIMGSLTQVMGQQICHQQVIGVPWAQPMVPPRLN